MTTYSVDGQRVSFAQYAWNIWWTRQVFGSSVEEVDAEGNRELVTSRRVGDVERVEQERGYAALCGRVSPRGDS